ncbi:30S ribosomal protein S18 [Candidatus Berkelbacteria bacterium]|nr:30S ribosomal protein S18 [Candidatus Berkelbacteria bacterium]
MAQYQRRKSCPFCRKHLIDVDYKEAAVLGRYLSGWSKIKPSKETGACAKHQRRLAEAIKRARFLALLPYLTR